jgi:hypothetical protein
MKNDRTTPFEVEIPPQAQGPAGQGLPRQGQPFSSRQVAAIRLPAGENFSTNSGSLVDQRSTGLRR